MSESYVQRDIIAWLYDNGYWFERINSGSAFVGSGSYKKRITLARKGCPDILACVNGLLVGIELKKDEKEYKRWIGIKDRYIKALKDDTEIKKSWGHTIDQYDYAVDMTRSGAKYILTYSVDHLKGEIEKIKNQN